MANPRTFEIKESVSQLKAQLTKQKTLKGEKRLKALLMIKQNKINTRKKLAEYLQIDKRTLERWISRYIKGGLSALLTDLPKNKGSKIITQQIHDGLSARVHDIENPFSGYWEAQLWVKQVYGVEVKYQRIREYLIQHFGTKVKHPRKSHVKKDEDAGASFLKTTS